LQKRLGELKAQKDSIKKEISQIPAPGDKKLNENTRQDLGLDEVVLESKL